MSTTTTTINELPATPGIHAGVGMADYLALPGVSQSALKRFSRSALHVRHYLDSPEEPTDAQALGTAAHCALLEPERFAQDYFALPEGMDRRTRQGKLDYETALCDNAGKLPLPHDEHAACVAMARSARTHSPYVSSLLSGRGLCECVVLWQEPEYDNLPCKARLDRLCLTPEGDAVVLDPKTTRDASPGPFAGDCARYGYHVQAAWYLRGLQAVSPSDRPRRFVFLAMEKAPPFACAAYELCPDALAEGRNLVRDYLARYAECLASGRWPGYAPEPVLLQLPAWAYRDPNNQDREEVERGVA